MTEPATAAPKRSLRQRASAALAWAASPKGRHDIAGAVAVVTAIYTALHRAGI